MPQDQSLIDVLTALMEPKPVAYDRRFKIPIRIRYDMSDNAMASYLPDNRQYFRDEPITRPPKISLNGKYATGWQQGENEKMNKAVKHELVHHLTRDSFWDSRFNPHIYTPSNSLILKLLTLFSPQTELYSARDKVEENSKNKTIANMGGTTRYSRIDTGSEWIPWLLTDTIPKGLDEKFTPGEKQALKNDITRQYEEDMSDKYKKYKSIWE